MTTDIQMLNRRVDILEKALERERRARRESEQQLEIYSREEYLNQQRLLDALDKKKRKQTQLELLAHLMSSILTNTSLESLIQGFIEQIGQLTEYNWLANICIKDQQIDIENSYCCFKHEQWQCFNVNEWPSCRLNFVQEITLESWQVLCSEQHCLSSDNSCRFKIPFLLAYRYVIDRQTQGLIVIAAQEINLSNDTLQTLNTAAMQFNSAIARLISKEKLNRNYEQLSKTYQKLKSTQQQLIHSEKMASLGEMAAGIAHEINNPISFISSNLEVLNDYLLQIFTDESEGIGKNPMDKLLFIKQDSLEIIESSRQGVQRVADIVNSLRVFARKQTEESEPVNIVRCVSASLKVVENKLKYMYKVNNLLPDNLPNVTGHFGEMQQIFINLLVNAADAMPEGGEISIFCQLSESAIDVTIQDHGIGMNEQVKKHLFDPFFTTKEVQKGTGLGLSVTATLIEKNGFNIAVETELGSGSSFIITMPLMT